MNCKLQTAANGKCVCICIHFTVLTKHKLIFQLNELVRVCIDELKEFQRGKERMQERLNETENNNNSAQFY